jgi:hypothetical protein
MKSKFMPNPISVNPTLGFRAMFHHGTLSGCDTRSIKHAMVEIMVVRLLAPDFKATSPFRSIMQKSPGRWPEDQIGYL